MTRLYDCTFSGNPLSGDYPRLAVRILSALLHLLMWTYPLFLLALGLGIGALLVWLVVAAAHFSFLLALVAVIPLLLHLGALCQLIIALGLVRKLRGRSNEPELHL